VKALKILIVDDSSFMRKRLKSTLEKEGHKVVGTAKDGLEAFNLYKSIIPDLVIMDVTMQGVDGIEGAKLIKKDFPNAQIIFMSLVEDKDVIEEAKKLGAIDFLRKKENDKLFQLINKIGYQEQNNGQF